MDHDGDVPELTDADFSKARPFAEVFPERHRSWKKRGRPMVEKPKVLIGFRLDADVVSGIKALGRGYKARVEKVLREALVKGEL